MPSVSDVPWDLHERGSIDRRRHQEKLREAIREKLPHLVGDTPLVDQNGKTRVKMRLKGVQLPRFRYGTKQDNEGLGNGPSAPGDIIDRRLVPGEGAGKGSEPGEDPDEHEVILEFDLDELVSMVFEELKLPRLVPKQTGRMVEHELVWDTRRKVGPWSLLDRRRTLLNAVKSSLLLKHERLQIHQEDLEFRSWNERAQPITNAVVVLLRDVSGSMYQDKRYLSRVMAFWIVQWLRKSYDQVIVEFWCHDTRAWQVPDETTFFNLSERGGTSLTPVYKTIDARLKKEYPDDDWNKIVLHFTDGDDNPIGGNYDQTIAAAKALAQQLVLFGFAELRPGEPTHRTSALLPLLIKHVPNPPFAVAQIHSREDVVRGIWSMVGGQPIEEAAG